MTIDSVARRVIAWFVLIPMALVMRPAIGAEKATAIAIDSFHLNASVHMIRSDSPIGNPTTVVSIGSDGVFVADPNLLLVNDALKAEIERLGGTSIRYVTATHYHGDHSEGFESIAAGATVIVPEGQRRRLATGAVVLGERPIKKEALPVMTFTDSVTLRMNGEEIRILTPPNKSGHTDGDAFVHFRHAGVLYVGDYLFLDRFPLIDLEGGGDLEGYLANIEYVLDRFPADTLIVPGHGTFRPAKVIAIDMGRYRTYLETLRESVAIIRERVADGVTLEENVDAGLPDKFAGFGARPRYVKTESWIRFVHDYYANGGRG